MTTCERNAFTSLLKDFGVTPLATIKLLAKIRETIRYYDARGGGAFLTSDLTKGYECVQKRLILLEEELKSCLVRFVQLCVLILIVATLSALMAASHGPIFLVVIIFITFVLLALAVAHLLSSLADSQLRFKNSLETCLAEWRSTLSSAIAREGTILLQSLCYFSTLE
jgi:hypothetical protein